MNARADTAIARPAPLLGFAPPEGKQPRATYKGLHDMFISLWTALDEAHWRAHLLAERHEEYSKETRQTLENIVFFTDVDRVHGEIIRLLSEAGSFVDSKEDQLREQIGKLVMENATLVRELKELKGRSADEPCAASSREDNA